MRVNMVYNRYNFGVKKPPLTRYSKHFVGNLNGGNDYNGIIEILILFGGVKLKILKLTVKSILGLFVIVAFAGVLIFVYFLFMDLKHSKNAENEKVEHHVNEQENEEEKVKQVDSYENPFGDNIKKDGLDEQQIRKYVHGMSHQKVETEGEEKWIFYEITEERIDWLIDALNEENIDINQDDKFFYQETLNRWKNNDFSQAVSEHNVIWEKDGGNIGKAIRLFTEEEEKDYVDFELN